MAVHLPDALIIKGNDMPINYFTSTKADAAANLKNDVPEKVLGKKPFRLILKVSKHVLDDWVNEGMPVEKPAGPGKPYVFNVKKVKHWLENDQNSIASSDQGMIYDARTELARQRQLTADKIALQLEQMRGGLIEVEQMEFILNLITEQIVAQLETIVPQVRRRLPTLPAQATEVISDVIARASNACADLPEHFLESLPEPARKRYRTHAPRLEIVSSAGATETE